MAQGFTVRVYGTVNEQPPYVGDVSGQLPAVSATYASTNVQPASFPTDRVNLWPIQPGVKMAGGFFCYGVVEIPAQGLNQYSQKFVVAETITTLATLRG